MSFKITVPPNVYSMQLYAVGSGGQTYVNQYVGYGFIPTMLPQQIRATYTNVTGGPDSCISILFPQPGEYIYEVQVNSRSVNPGAFRTQLWFNAPMRQCRLIEAAPVAAPIEAAPAQAPAAVRSTSVKKHYGKPE
jgi:hypothetical protein